MGLLLLQEETLRRLANLKQISTGLNKIMFESRIDFTCVITLIFIKDMIIIYNIMIKGARVFIKILTKLIL